MKFKYTNFSREGRYSIGIEEESGNFYISILVRNFIIEGEECYRISPAEFKLFSEDIDKAKDLADRCRHRLEDERLLYQPFTTRGYPC